MNTKLKKPSIIILAAFNFCFVCFLVAEGSSVGFNPVSASSSAKYYNIKKDIYAEISIEINSKKECQISLSFKDKKMLVPLDKLKNIKEIQLQPTFVYFTKEKSGFYKAKLCYEYYKEGKTKLLILYFKNSVYDHLETL